MVLTDIAELNCSASLPSSQGWGGGGIELFINVKVRKSSVIRDQNQELSCTSEDGLGTTPPTHPTSNLHRPDLEPFPFKPGAETLRDCFPRVSP